MISSLWCQYSSWNGHISSQIHCILIPSEFIENALAAHLTSNHMRQNYSSILYILPCHTPLSNLIYSFHLLSYLLLYHTNNTNKWLYFTQMKFLHSTSFFKLLSFPLLIHTALTDWHIEYWLKSENHIFFWKILSLFLCWECRIMYSPIISEVRRRFMTGVRVSCETHGIKPP